MNHSRFLWCGLALSLGLAAATCSPHSRETAERVVIASEGVSWVGSQVATGAKIATLYGNRAEPGPSTIRMKLPPNATIRPHSHPTERQVTVLSGTLHLGLGQTVDAAQTISLTEGAFFTQMAGEDHFIMSGSEGFEIQITDLGP